ncbi:hypothetical protein [Streptomyces sp. NRRL WC-3742]|uniref:hypothetical protein n=1 Tax=Streptomyces sp. NRRL WC-3742 TaxID=1463934 RepID=UPI0004C9806E|nr:hypothetical protein [Streptomyces sp. NRRL WC-3742]
MVDTTPHTPNTAHTAPDTAHTAPNTEHSAHTAPDTAHTAPNSPYAAPHSAHCAPASVARPARAHRTVRLAFLWRAAGAPLGCLAALALGLLLTRTGAAARLGAVPALLLSTAAVLAAAAPVPFGFWLRARPAGLTLVRAYLPRRYAWEAIHSLAMETSPDPDTGAARLVLHLRLHPHRPHPHRLRLRRTGPVLGVLATTPAGLPRGTEPPHLARLFDLLRRNGVPLGDSRFADLVLTAHGYPALAHTARTARAAPAVRAARTPC